MFCCEEVKNSRSLWDSGPFGFGVIQNAASNVPRWCDQQDTLNWATTEHFKLPPIFLWASFVPPLKLYPMPELNCQRYICQGPGNTSHTAQDAVRVSHFKVFYFLLGFNVPMLMVWCCGLCWLCRFECQTHFYWQQGCARQGSGTAADNQV